VRGSSALQRALESAPGAKATVLVIWEPVILTDRGPPSARKRARLADPRVTQYWDEGLLLSQEIVRTIRADRTWLEAGGLIDFDVDEDDAVAWDVVAVFPPGVRWESSFPRASWLGAPVVHHEAELRARLAASKESTDAR
jgi:hypothetical protein